MVGNRGEKKKTKTQKTEPKNRLTGLIFPKNSLWLTELKKFCGFAFGFGLAIWDLAKRALNRMVNRWLTETNTYTFIKKTKFYIGQV